jgi:hypothetical protein
MEGSDRRRHGVDPRLKPANDQSPAERSQHADDSHARLSPFITKRHETSISAHESHPATIQYEVDSNPQFICRQLERLWASEQ